MAENIEKDKKILFTASSRMVDKDGKKVPWELKAINAKEDEKIRASCTVKVSSKRGGVRMPETDINKYIGLMVASCVLYPNLNDKALQDSYGVLGASELLKVMLKPGEFADLTTQVQTINGFDVSMEQMVDSAKNS